MQEGLRAGMHFLVRDLTQAGEGIPQGGIELPYTVTSNVNRPGTGTIFPDYLLAGNHSGQPDRALATSINPTNNAVLTGIATDIINILYADNVLQDTAGNYLYSYPVVQAAPSVPVCAGAIDPAGASVTLAPGCFTMPGVANPITTGNLIMFHNRQFHGAGIRHQRRRPTNQLRHGRSREAESNRGRVWNGCGAVGLHAGKFSADFDHARVVGHLLH